MARMRASSSESSILGSDSLEEDTFILITTVNDFFPFYFRYQLGPGVPVQGQEDKTVNS